MDTIYDVIILGAGPAGLSAAIYAGRGRLNTLLLEQGQDGGQIALTAHLDNYPGQLEGDSGSSLIARMSAQADRAGIQRIRDTIRTAELDGPVKKLAGRTEAYLAKTVILASGASPRPIGCKNEDAYVGRGISFCATCDAAFFRDLEVFVAGGGNAAVEEALYLTGFARSVTLIYSSERLTAPKILQEQAARNPKLRFLPHSVVEEVGGEGHDVLDRMVIRNVQTGQLTELRADSLGTGCSACSASWASSPAPGFSRDSWTRRGATSLRTPTCTPTSPVSSPPETSGKRACGRWSPPLRTALLPPFRRNGISGS